MQRDGVQGGKSAMLCSANRTCQTNWALESRCAKIEDGRDGEREDEASGV